MVHVKVCPIPLFVLRTLVILTRRLVDVSRDLIIREVDCCEEQRDPFHGRLKAFMDGKEVIEDLEENHRDVISLGRLLIRIQVSSDQGQSYVYTKASLLLL